MAPRALLTVWQEADGWRVADDLRSELYPARAQAVAFAERLADEYAQRGETIDLVVQGGLLYGVG